MAGLKVLLITGALVTASLAAASATATAATAPPVMDTSVLACSNGVCEVGPGNVGTPFAAGLNIVTGTVANPNGEKFVGGEYAMKIISGSLPPGLQLSLPDTEWTVTGTPTKAGTYPFTVQANTSTWDDGLLALSAHINDPCGAENSRDITLKDSLGSSVTVTLPAAKY